MSRRDHRSGVCVARSCRWLPPVRLAARIRALLQEGTGQGGVPPPKVLQPRTGGQVAGAVLKGQ